MYLSCYGNNYHGDMLSNIYTLASLQRNVTLLWKEEVTCDLLFYEQDTSLKKKKGSYSVMSYSLRPHGL